MRTPKISVRPVDVAARLYAERGCQPAFGELLRWYFLHGAVRSTKRSFVMAQPTQFIIPETGTRTAGWFCSNGVGDIADMITGMPYPLPYVLFVRRGEDRVRFYRTDKFVKRIATTTSPGRPHGNAMMEIF